MAELTLSLVVPSHRDAPALATLLPLVVRYGCREIIVVGSEPDTETTALCERYGVEHILTQPCRGAQLDAGATHTTADVIWFLHADARPPKDAVEQILSAVSNGAHAGFFPFRFDGPRTAAKLLLATATNLRVTLGGIPYGDQGLFATRAAYDTAGGFPHTPLFEEVRLVKHLRRQGGLVQLQTPMSISPRRWERDGWWRRSLHNRWLALRFMCGTAPDLLAKSYTRADQTPTN